MGFLLYGIAILMGVGMAYVFTVPVNLVASSIAVAVAGYLLWSTRNAELGSLIGVIAAIEVGIYLAALWLTTAIISGFYLNLSFMLRSHP